MTRKDKLLKEITNKLTSICDNLLAYKKVDATLSEKTLLEIAVHLSIADEKLEKGFVEDACDEIDNKLKLN
jgi:hypothetical protein